MTAQDAFTALFGWESLTAAFYLLAGAKRGEPDRGGAARITVAFGKVSGAARTTALVLLLAGFAIKVGMVPFQVWLPHGYAAAPARPGRSWPACA